MHTLAHNYFSLLGLPCQFEVDLKRLHQQCHALQSGVHPDTFAQDLNAQSQAMQYASMVNEAKQVLGNTAQRTKYLLSLHGVEIEDEGTFQDPNILGQQFEILETIEHCLSHQDQAHLSAMLQTLEQDRMNCIQQISESFNQQQHDAVAQHYFSLVFYEKSLARLRQAALDIKESLL